MPTSPRVIRSLVIASAAATSLWVAACEAPATPSASNSTAKTATSGSSAPAPSPAPPANAGRDRSSGIVATVAGGTVTLTAADGPTTVDVTAATRVAQLTAAQLTDITAGECLVVRPTKDGSGPTGVTAAAVLFGPAQDGQCVPDRHRGRAVIGTVGSVNGNAITLTTPDQGRSTVTVTPATRYAKRAIADPSAIAAGQCLVAQGAKAGDGSLQATTVAIRPATSGPCGGNRPS
jgi:hypothetical protein